MVSPELPRYCTTGNDAAICKSMISRIWFSTRRNRAAVFRRKDGFETIVHLHFECMAPSSDRAPRGPVGRQPVGDVP